jgi:hypothetical protein
MKSPLEALAPADKCFCFGDVEECICPATERGLRIVIRGQAQMSPEQREWCLTEIGRVEGYKRSAYEEDDDATIARGVLSAWLDFARDKGFA